MLRELVEMRENIQRFRIRLGNQIKAIESGRDSMNPEYLSFLKTYYQDFLEKEEDITARLEKEAKMYPIISIMSQLKYISFVSAAKLVSVIDIRKATTPAKLWRYCGYAVIDGKAEKPKKGERRHDNRYAKTTVYQISVNLIRKGSPYRLIYDRSLRYYEAKHSEWTKSHRHYAALRRVAKLFLSHLWTTWRKLEGLPTRDPYAIEVLGHDRYYDPVEFGWPNVGGSNHG